MKNISNAKDFVEIINSDKFLHLTHIVPLAMGMRSYWKYFFLFMWMIMSVSCKKEVQPRTPLLTSGPWKLTALTFHGDWDGDGVVDPVDKDLFTENSACTNDDRLTFNVDGSGTYDNGPDDCDYGVPQVLTFSWSFYNPYSGTTDEDVIKFKNFGFDALSIVELNSTTLKVKNLGSGWFQLYTYSH